MFLWPFAVANVRAVSPLMFLSLGLAPLDNNNSATLACPSLDASYDPMGSYLALLRFEVRRTIRTTGTI